jgi:glycosyltransferase involved in cell wall biosynthesis
MKITHIIAGNLNEGAARGAYWLHLQLLKNGVESQIITNSKYIIKDEKISYVQQGILNKIYFALISRLLKLPLFIYPNKKKYIFSSGLFGSKIKLNKFYLNADVIHLHWINGLISTNVISQINKPLIWTLRDMWPFTGGCHVSMGCDRYQIGCGKCPILGSSSELDLTKLFLLQKKEKFHKSLQLVGVSKWITDCAKNSLIFNQNPIVHIPNLINLDIFYPVNKKFARKTLNLPLSKKIILVAAQNLDDPWKGFDLLLESTKYLKTKNWHFVFFGRISTYKLKILNHSYSDLGFLDDDQLLRLAYSAADVFAAPSMFESFGKMIAESMSCGTPAVCFNTSGQKDIIEHEVSGFKADPYDPISFAKGVDWVLTRDKESYLNLCEYATLRILTQFNPDLIANAHVTLYKKVIQN